MYFSVYGLSKTGLDNCLRILVSEDLSTSNMVRAPKHFWNLNHGTFTSFIDPYEDNKGWKGLSERYAKS